MTTSENQLQDLCEQGQDLLMQTEYLKAAATLARAEQQAWESRSFDTLSRLYLPLQEARRQIRQRCGEGAIRMHLIARSAADTINATEVIAASPHGQILVAGWDSPAAAMQIRQLVRSQGLYLETFLGAVQPGTESDPTIKVYPTADWPKTATCLMIRSSALPPDALKGNSQTYADVMAIWEQLHGPFLESAKQHTDPIQQMQAYRFTLQVDPACELAHQFLADIARHLARVR